MYADFCDFVFNGMGHIVEFQEHIYFDDAFDSIVTQIKRKKEKQAA